MCGIAGYSCFSDYDDRLDIAITTLGLFMQERGRQSWGWTDGQQLVKSTGAIRDGFNTSFFGFKKAALHTRHATTGAITKENAHPFKIGNIVGMHNGIVHNHDELNKQYDRNFPVDSMHILAHLDEGKDMEDIRAYGAICFFKDGDIHIGRWNSGELSLARTKTAWVFASTMTALTDALRLSGLAKDAVYYKLKEERCYRLSGGTIHRTDIKLNFGSYSKSWATWESGGNRPTQAGSTTGTKGNSSGTGFSVNDRRYHSDGNGSGTGNSKEESKSNTSESSTGAPTVPNDVRSLPIGRMTVGQKLADMVDAAVNTYRSDTRKNEAEWHCCWCKVELVDGKPYYVTNAYDLACEDCSTRYVEDCIGGPLTILPQEIMKVSAFIGNSEADKDDHMSCDFCGEFIFAADFFVHTKDNDLICTTCWIEEKSAEDDEDDVLSEADFLEGSVDMQDIAAADEEYFRRNEQKWKDGLRDRGTVQGVISPETAAGLKKSEKAIVLAGTAPNSRPANEAENLKKFGSGMPPSNDDKVLPNPPSRRWLN